VYLGVHDERPEQAKFLTCKSCADDKWYYHPKEKQCNQCDANRPGCVECHDDGACYKCEEHMFLKDGQCILCHTQVTDCIRCWDGGCSQCHDGYQKVGDGNCVHKFW